MSFVNANKNELNVSKNDLLYYIDDHHFVSKSGSTTKKYKILKLKHKTRRSGLDHLIQEEGNDGIAIVNLGGGPIPEFRLPRSRRQYMPDHGEEDDDDEILPPDGDTVVNNPYVVDDDIK
ncbi:uncharacterized protein LOC123703689 [Colias croceus]|uniref:uncharacterized protein LOC123703689 n=1 Tax=Colias crocea TaxID=72248 RepID=UPI001E280FF7|nr:uncharacterized protein LOC123703689 [Colias croceus]